MECKNRLTAQAVNFGYRCPLSPGKVGRMNGRKQRRMGCLIFLLLIVVLPGLLIRRQLRRERLSVQLVATVKDVLSLSETNYDPTEDKNGRERERLRQQRRNEEGEVVRLLKEGADPDVRDLAAVKLSFWEQVKFVLKRMFRRSPAPASLPRSALAIAVEADDAAIVTALLKAGANDVNAEIETRGDSARFPLVNYGAYNGDLDIVKELCAHGADIHKLSQLYNPAGEPILLSTLSGSNLYRSYRHKVTEVSEDLERRRRTKIFHLLLAKGAKYQPNSKDGYALLHAATEGDFLEVTRELLAAGVPTNAEPKWLDYTPEYSPLDAAANSDDIALVKLLLQYGASTRDPQSESPMLGLKSPEMARLLMEHGADIHATHMRGKYSGQNALNYACIEGETKLVAFLIAQGLSVNSSDYTSPINQAAEYGNVETVRLLLEHGAKVGPKSPGAEALFLAIAEQKFDSAKLILRYGAAVNAKEGAPLGEATRQDNAAMALELLKRGANVNAGKGEALIAACESCDEDLVELLLEYGADPNVRSDDGTTAIQTAQQNADPQSDADGIIALLKDYGAKR
jgi:ankyrin repeat protein